MTEIIFVTIYSYTKLKNTLIAKNINDFKNYCTESGDFAIARLNNDMVNILLKSDSGVLALYLFHRSIDDYRVKLFQCKDMLSRFHNTKAAEALCQNKDVTLCNNAMRMHTFMTKFKTLKYRDDLTCDDLLDYYNANGTGLAVINGFSMNDFIGPLSPSENKCINELRVNYSTASRKIKRIKSIFPSNFNICDLSSQKIADSKVFLGSMASTIPTFVDSFDNLQETLGDGQDNDRIAISFWSDLNSALINDYETSPSKDPDDEARGNACKQFNL